MQGVRAPLQGSQAGFGTGVSLCENPGFRHIPTITDGLSDYFLTTANPMASVLQWCPGWFNYGGVSNGDIENISSANPLDSGAAEGGVRITSNANFHKGLVSPIPRADRLHGRRIRFRALYRPISGTDVGLTASLSGRVHKQVWNSSEQLGTTGMVEKTFASGSSGFGHLVAAVPKPSGSSDLTNPFSVYDPPSSGVGSSIHARPTTLNRFFDSWETVESSGKSSITIDLPGVGGGTSGGNEHDEDHDVFFLDYDVDPSSGNYSGTPALVQIESHDGGPDTGDLVELDVIFTMPESGDSDDPVHGPSGVTWLVLTTTDTDSPVAHETVIELYWCDLQVLDDNGPYAAAASSERVLGSHQYVQWCLAYPVYAPQQVFVGPTSWTQDTLNGDSQVDPPTGTLVVSSPTYPVRGVMPPLPMGAVIYEVELNADYVVTGGVDQISLGVRQLSRAQLRAYDSAAKMQSHVIGEAVASSDQTDVAVAAARNRIGTLTTTHADQDLTEGLWEGQEQLALYLDTTDSYQSIFGATIRVLVDPRLVWAGFVPRSN